MIPTIKEAEKFHGHLGPYLVLGLLAGNLGLKKTGVKKYFGMEVRVFGANIKPKSCLIDGLQLSTGATFGKGNIKKFSGSDIKIIICNLKNHKKVSLSLAKELKKELDCLKGHSDSERFARRLLNKDTRKIFNQK